MTYLCQVRPKTLTQSIYAMMVLDLSVIISISVLFSIAVIVIFMNMLLSVIVIVRWCSAVIDRPL